MTTKTEKVQKVNQDANHFDFFSCFLGTLPRNSETPGIMGLHWALLQSTAVCIKKVCALELKFPADLESAGSHVLNKMSGYVTGSCGILLWNVKCCFWLQLMIFCFSLSFLTLCEKKQWVDVHDDGGYLNWWTGMVKSQW